MKARSPVVLIAEMVRHDKWRPVSRRRRYTRLGNAIGSMAKWMATDGYVGDVVVLYDAESMLEVGTMKLTSAGKIISAWIWDKK